MNAIRRTRLLVRGAGLLPAFLLSLVTAHAGTLFVGFNTATPVQLYSTGGAYVQDLGPMDAIAAIPATSSYFFAEPNGNAGNTTISQYDASLSQIGSFTISDLVEDGAAGTGGTLWLASYGGTIYQVSTAGSVNTSWSTSHSHGGVTFDGTYVYTTEGDDGSNIDKWSTNGSLLGTIATPVVGLYGLGYDPETGDFWAGSFGNVYQFDASGNLLNSLDLSGDGRTPGGATHDSVNVGELLTPMSTVPEPSSPYLFGLGLLVFAGVSLARRKALKPAIFTLAVVSSAGVVLANVNVSLTPSLNTAQVGTTVVWTANATDTANSNAKLTYQFSAGPSAAQLQVKKDFSNVKTFAWTPSDSEGVYTMQVIVNSSTGATGTSTALYSVTSRVTGTAPVISHTNHPLVALYSVPPCPAGRTARVRFKTSGDNVWQATNPKACTGDTSLNFYVAGMRASTTYTLQQDVYNGPFDTPGPLMTFTTGTVPSGLLILSSSISHAASQPNATAYPVVLTSPGSHDPIATDTQGHLIWYLASADQGGQGYLTRPVPGGTFLTVTDDSSGVVGNRHLLREWDLAGNVVRETNVAAISKQLVAFGTDPVTSVHHEAFRFPNGDTGVIASVERVADQGSGPVDVLADMAIVLDTNLQVKWWWNEFEHLDIKHPATLGETCNQNPGGCEILTIPGYKVANDWTHSNSLAPTPDGNLVISLRHQDWLIKLNYQNGKVAAWRRGDPDNTILWKLGKDGDFRANANDAYPWFSHQHDATFTPSGTLTVYDNGNTRIAAQGGNSRGQEWRLDEQNMVATPVLNLDLGVYSGATGSAQRLSNGNYEFYDGFVGGTHAKTSEYSPAGVLQFEQELPAGQGYRSFRMRSLYTEY